MSQSKNFFLNDEAATLAFATKLAALLPCNQLISMHLVGNLGAGKTTFSRGLIQALGHQGNVKSPTYTLVERYDLGGRPVYHFDLYRLADPEELLYLGIEDYFDDKALCLIEWPDKGEPIIPQADLSIELSYAEAGRNLKITAHSAATENILDQLK
jgi:tRNA threonylcarbamoyladenosine biosynthesis protein TsaE